MYRCFVTNWLSGWCLPIRSPVVNYNVVGLTFDTSPISNSDLTFEDSKKKSVKISFVPSVLSVST